MNMVICDLKEMFMYNFIYSNNCLWMTSCDPDSHANAPAMTFVITCSVSITFWYISSVFNNYTYFGEKSDLPVWYRENMHKVVTSDAQILRLVL